MKSLYSGRQKSRLVAAVIIMGLLCVVVRVQAQPLTANDFSIGFLKLESPVDTVIAHLGKPDSSWHDKYDNLHTKFFFPHVLLWSNNRTHEVWGIEIVDSTFVTSRGLKVGDPVWKVAQLYGDDGTVKTEFSMTGPYTWFLRNYSHAIWFRSGDYHFVVFAKDQKVVRITLFRELYLTHRDYGAGSIVLGDSLDSVKARLGKPDSVKAWEGHPDWVGYYYPKLVLWGNMQDRSVFALDVYDPAFATCRGLHIGDSVSTIERLYGDRENTKEQFGRVGPYEGIRDYTEATVFGASHYIVFFTKGEKIVAMLFYVGVEE